MEALIEIIEKELEEIKKIMESGDYGFIYAKGFLREAKKHCKVGDLEKCLDYIRKAGEGAEREKMASILDELRNVVRSDLSPKRLYEEVVSRSRGVISILPRTSSMCLDQRLRKRFRGDAMPGALEQNFQR